jgi:pectinesterase
VRTLEIAVSVWVAAVALAAQPADLIVAADGTGQFKSVQEAVDRAPSHSRQRFVIHIRPGIYKERVTVPPEKTFLTLRGEDARSTVITFDARPGPGQAFPGSNRPEMITFDTPTVFIQANDFTAENITFENSAGRVGQALALTIMSDRGVFRNCRFLGFQDTLLAQAGRQYFDHCYIQGATDFIFGGSTAFFDKCEIHVTANGYITAANTPKDQQYGYVFSHCKITGEANALTVLGRPWRPYAATVFLNTEMSANVRPAGWNNWNDPGKEKTARYAEYASSGPGGEASARVGWARQLTDAEAKTYSIESVLGGVDGWDPRTASVRSMMTVVKAAGASERAALTNSTDGYNWSLSPLHRDAIMAKLHALDVASPHIYRDEQAGRYIVTWASTFPANSIQSFQEGVENNPRIFYAITTDLTTFSDPQLLFDPNYSVKYAVILKDGDRFALLHNDNTTPMHNLRVAFGPTPRGPWGPSRDAFTDKFVEIPAAIQLDGEWWIYATNSQTGAVTLFKTRDFWTYIDAGPVTLPAGFRMNYVQLPPDRVH